MTFQKRNRAQHKYKLLSQSGKERSRILQNAPQLMKQPLKKLPKFISQITAHSARDLSEITFGEKATKTFCGANFSGAAAAASTEYNSKFFMYAWHSLRGAFFTQIMAGKILPAINRFKGARFIQLRFGKSMRERSSRRRR